jgi:hypothetical protein
MDKFEFIHHIENFKTISKEDSKLCLIFVSNDKAHALKEGKFYLFSTMIEAFKWSQNIESNKIMELHNLKYMLSNKDEFTQEKPKCEVYKNNDPVLILR